MLFRSLVNDVGDKFGSAPAGLGFRRSGAPGRRNDTKRYGPYHVCTGVIRVVDAKDSPTLSVRSFTGIDFSLSSLHALLAPNSRNGETGGNIVKSWVIPLSWDFVVSTLTHPSKELHIGTLFGAPVNDVGDKFGSAPAGLAFCRRGALEHHNDTKRKGRT